MGRPDILWSVNKLARAVTKWTRACDSDFAGDLEDSESTSRGRREEGTFVPVSWMCKKQTSVSHSSTESEVIFLGAGLRMDGIPALDLRDVVIEVLHSPSNQPAQGDLLRDEDQRQHTNTKTKKHSHRDDLESSKVDHNTTNAKPSHFGALLFISEDNEAVIKMSRTHRGALDWLLNQLGHQKSKSNTLIPKTNSQTCQRKATSLVMSGIILSVCSTS